MFRIIIQQKQGNTCYSHMCDCGGPEVRAGLTDDRT